MLARPLLVCSVALLGCGSSADEQGSTQQPDPQLTEPPAGPTVCVAPATPSEQPLTVNLPSELVTVVGGAGGNVTSLVFRSVLTGARYGAVPDADGQFERALPPGDYSVELTHSGGDFIATRAGQSVEVPSGVSRHEHTPCAGEDCVIAPATLPARSTDPAMTGSISGQLLLASGEAGTMPGTVGRVALTPVTLGEGDRTYTQQLGPDLTFEFTDVAYGSYQLSYRSLLTSWFAEDPSRLADTAFPVGKWTFADAVEVEQAQTNWQGSLPVRRTHLEILVNNEPMRDNGRGPDSRGRVSLLDEGSPPTVLELLPLGPRGPASFDIPMLPGRYGIGLSSHRPAGGGILEPMDQDVLPMGDATVAQVEIATQDSADAPVTLTLNASVLPVRFQLSDAAAGEAALQLTGHSAYTWVNPVTQDEAAPLMHPGCYASDAGSTAGLSTSRARAQFGPTLGQFCVPCPGGS